MNEPTTNWTIAHLHATQLKPFFNMTPLDSLTFLPACLRWSHPYADKQNLHRNMVSLVRITANRSLAQGRKSNQIEQDRSILFILHVTLAVLFDVLDTRIENLMKSI